MFTLYHHILLLFTICRKPGSNVIKLGGGGGGRLILNSHKGCKLRDAIIRYFSGGNHGIREDIPVPGGQRKETTLYASTLAEGI